jgi:hypothetical protein
MICLPNSKSTELNPLVKFIMTRIGAYVHRSFVSKIKNVIGKIKEGLRTNLYIYTSIYFFNQSGKNSDYMKKLRTNLHIHNFQSINKRLDTITETGSTMYTSYMVHENSTMYTFYKIHR